MRKFLLIIVLFLSVSICCYSVEPKNNLFKTLYELRYDFPDLRLWSDQGSYQIYTSDGVFFEAKNDRIYAEYMLVEGANFAYDWYMSTRNAFLKTQYSSIFRNTETDLWLFYSNFSIDISYDVSKGTAMIIYEVLPRYKW